jgi:hypothetical protein
MVTDEQGTCNISRLSDDPATTANLTPSPVKGLSSSGRRRLRKEFSRLKRPMQAIRKNLNRRSHIPIVNSTIPEEDDNIGPMGGERSCLSMVVPGDRHYSSTLFSHHLQHQFDHHHHMHIFDPDDDEYNDKDEDEGRNNESYHKSTNNSNLQAFRDSISKSWDEEENNNNDNDDDDDNIYHCSHHSNQQGCSIFDDDETTYTGKNSMGGDSSYQNSMSVATTTIASSLSSWFPSFSSLSSRHSSSSFRGGEEELLLTIDGYVHDEDPMNNNDTTVVMVLYDRAVIVYDYLTKMRTVLFTMIFERWAFWLFGIYVSFFILFDIFRSSSSSSSTTATSTDITELEILQTDSNAGDNDTTTSTFQLILTTMYASFIITSFGFVWGRSIVIYRKLISRRILEQQEHRQSYLQAEVLSAFCSPHRHQQKKRLFQGDNYFTDGSRQKQSISKEIIIKGGQTHNNNTGARRNRRRKRKNDQYYWSTSWWSHRLAHMWLVPVLVLALAFAMSQTSEWSMIQILYYVFITGKSVC